MTEPEIIYGLRLGDTNAYKSAYIAYKKEVFVYILKLVKSSEDAEELTQDVFVKAFRKIYQFTGDSKFLTWLISIARNTAFTFLKSTNKRKEVINDEADVEGNYGWIQDSDDPDKILSQKDEKRIVLKAISSLTHQQQTAYTLFAIEGISQLEIAEIMGLSIHAIESLISRSKTKLRKILKPHYQNYL